MTPTETLEYLIENNQTLILSTADESGKPWVSPLGYAFDKECSFYWISSKNAVHSKNVRSRKDAAATIVGEVRPGEVDGVYFEFKVFELSIEADVREGLEIYGKLPQPAKWQINSLEDITGRSVWRLYKAVIVKAYKRVDEIEEGRAVTARISVELP